MILKPPTKVLILHKIWGMLCPPMIGFSSPQKISPWNGHFLLVCESFLPQKFPAIQYIPSNEQPATQQASNYNCKMKKIIIIMR